MKASKTDIREIVIDQLRAGYTPRWSAERNPVQHGEQCDLLVTDIEAQNYSRAGLKAGMTVFRREWTYARWPVFGELDKFLARGGAAQQPRVEQHDAKAAADPEKWAAQMMHSQAGQRAIADGCPYEFWFWCKHNPGKTPQDEDERTFRENERIGRARLKDLREHPENYPTDHAKWLAMGEKFRRENDRLARQYSRERAA